MDEIDRWLQRLLTSALQWGEDPIVVSSKTKDSSRREINHAINGFGQSERTPQS
jgi:hypothetical protein